MKIKTIARSGKSATWLIIAFLLVAAGVGYYFYSQTSAAPQYNILLVTFDTTRADRIGCYGHTEGRTPTIDSLAKSGIVYEHCIAPSPITQPSHSTLLTGLYPFRHGIRDNSVGTLSPNVETLPEILKGIGYKTGAAVGAFVLDSKFGLDQGFDNYDDDGMQDSATNFGFAERIASDVTDAAIDWLKANGDDKFFFWAHYFDPHAGYSPPGVNREPYLTSQAGVRKLYDLEITYTDAQLARLLNHVKSIETKTGRPTLVVITSDHGESLQNHGEPSHGMLVYEDTVHVPLVIYDSLNPERGKRVPHSVALADVMPTILDRVKLPVPYEIDGRLLPAPGQDVDPERAIYFETIMPYTNYGWSPLEGVTIGRKKFIRAPRPEFYDLESDPKELNNLYKENDSDIEELAYSLDDIKEAQLNHPNITAEELALDEHDLRKLMSLGYLASLDKAELDDENLRDPKDGMHLHRLQLRSMSLISKGMAERAFEDIDAILTEEPDNEKAFENLVRLAKEFGNRIPPLDKAIGLIRRKLEKKPDADAAVALGMLYEHQKNDPAALTAFSKAVELDGENLAALNNSAFYLFKLDGDLELAQSRSEKVISLLDADEQLRESVPAGKARHTLACILMAQDKNEEAVPYLQAATKLVPDFAAAFYQLGLARYKLGETKMAGKLLKHAVELAEDSDTDWLRDAKSRLTEIGN